MYQPKSLTLLVLLVALFAGVASFQADGGRWRDVARDLKLEARDDSIAIREDAAGIRDAARSAPLEIKIMGASLGYHVTELQAAAKSETKIAVGRFSPRPKDQ